MFGPHRELNFIRFGRTNLGSGWRSLQHNPEWARGFRKSAEAVFLLPVSAEELFLTLLGSRQYGEVMLKQGGQKDDLVVNVRVAYQKDIDLDRASVHRYREGKRHGILIITPEDKKDTLKKLCFHVTLTFPAPSSDAPLRIKKLSMESRNFNYHVEDIAKTTKFDDLRLKARNGSVQVGSITLASGWLELKNGSIGGKFNATEELTLDTVNGDVEPIVSLSSTGGATTRLRLRARNGSVSSQLSLVGEKGKFSVKGWSTRGDVKLEYRTMPTRAHLKSEAITKHGRADVDMHARYEGRFQVTTESTPGTFPSVGYDPEDPSRLVYLEILVPQHEIRGSVKKQGVKRNDEGSCIVCSNKGMASLNLRSFQGQR